MSRFHNINGKKVQFTHTEEEARNIAEAAYEAHRPTKIVRRNIRDLEGLETPSRLAEAILTAEGREWLQANRDKIAIERDKLR